MEQEHGGKPQDHCRHTPLKSEDQSRRRHELDVPAAHAAPNEGGKQQRQGCENAQQPRRFKGGEAGQGDQQAERVGDDPFAEIKNGSRKQQSKKMPP